MGDNEVTFDDGTVWSWDIESNTIRSDGPRGLFEWTWEHASDAAMAWLAVATH